MAENIPTPTLLAKHLARTLAPHHAELIEPFLVQLLQAQAQGHTGCMLDQAQADKLSGLACVSDQSDAPLVLNGHWLQFQRLWRKEQLILQHLQALQHAPIQSATLSDSLKQAAQNARLNREKFPLIQKALNQRLTLLTGGPGTGKTTTLAWLLAAWLEARPDTIITLCAPTGKAAQRMHQALQNALKNLPESLKAPLSTLKPATLHRLLGIEALSGQPKYHAERPLPTQLVVVDEASMVDVFTMAKLVDALPDNASLILMGDPNQLASVEAGQVLGALVDILPEAHVALTRGHRSDEIIAQLADLILAGEDDKAWLMLAENDTPQLSYLGSNPHLPQLAQGYAPYLTLLTNQTLPTEKHALALLKALARYRILTALRQGSYGATWLNQQLIEYFRSQQQLAFGKGDYFAGHAIQITENDYTLGLFNGDMGVMLPAHKGDQSVWFMDEGDSVKRVPYLQLPAYETAFATTVHKAQGDEFDTTLLLLPPEPHPLITRELIYTALTRAKNQFQLAGAEASFKDGINTPTQRKSGLNITHPVKEK